MTKEEGLKICASCHHFTNGTCDDWHEDCKQREIYEKQRDICERKSKAL